MAGLQPAGLSHSDTCGSNPVCRSPHIFAAYRVLLRRQKPRHPPFALCNFSCCESYLRNFLRRYVIFLLYEKVVPNFFRFYRLSISDFLPLSFLSQYFNELPLFLKRVAKVRTFFEVPNFSVKIFKKSCFLSKIPLKLSFPAP